MTPVAPVFNFLIKPASHHCNLDCLYCFYKPAAELYPGANGLMSRPEAETFINRVLAQGFGPYSFCWQGGEPTLLGLDFYRHVVEAQNKPRGPGRIINNSIQTNGLLLNDHWAVFLKEQRFLVGLSLDGPARMHDSYRKRADGRGTFREVMDRVDLLRRHLIPFNILTLLTQANIHAVEDLYFFFLENRLYNLQFIPCLDKTPDGRPRPYAVTGEDLGRFYLRLFDLWLEEGFPYVSIRLFEDILIYLLDGVHVSCGFSPRCDSYLLVEHNGDCYPCDFFVRPEWRLGNVVHQPLETILDHPKRLEFAGLRGDLSSKCRECSWLDLCRGDCPRHRETLAGSFGPLSECCPAWRLLLDHIQSHPANVVEKAWEARRSFRPVIHEKVGRNEPCPCGSGKKYKKCCLNLAV
ncbi:MAG: anaerobic sulfatase maturase [Thermodesulfobacteriota bacterium]